MKIYINGKFYPKEEAKISVFDHGLLYGDGVFEGIRSYSRLVFRLKEHINRLYESAHTIMLEIPLTKEQMIKAVVATLRKNGLNDAYIRLIVTRGEGDLGLDPRKCKGKASVIIIVDRIMLYPAALYKKGMEMITVSTTRNSHEALNPQIKCLNYLNNIMAKIEAVHLGYEEALMLNEQGYIAECTGDNIFIISKGELYTPPECMGALRGVTRDTVLEVARRYKIPTHEHVFTRHELYIADECFLTGTAAEIIPIVKVDGRVIGSGKPGKMTLSLTKKFKGLTKKLGVRY
ncbi:MAG: branched-chain-amino-acid transaminase [Candidatus Omnitrophica bacterium]|nr:branched-chain-amino-acid transaminase [Candidatus Omnitrophota bacterium]MDD5593010.1 branched-chain-amino-acid transaminase [Candidatus Omnitrophota bacterium]